MLIVQPRSRSRNHWRGIEGHEPWILGWRPHGWIHRSVIRGKWHSCRIAIRLVNGRLTEGLILAQDEISFTGLIEQYRTPCVSVDEEDGLLELLEPLMGLFVDLIRTGISPLRGQTSSIYIRVIKIAIGVLALALIAAWSITGWITATKAPH